MSKTTQILAIALMAFVATLGWLTAGGRLTNLRAADESKAEPPATCVAPSGTAVPRPGGPYG
jgi:hypothetical protein